MLKNVTGKIVLVGLAGTASVAAPLSAQVVDKGLAPAANTARSYSDGSINRDSGLYQPLDLLNDFYPSIEVVVSKHDNVRRRPDFDEDDLKIEINPALGYRTNFGRHQFYAAYQGKFTLHQEIDQEDAESNELNAKLGLDLSRRWDLELFGALGESFEERGISGSRNFTSFRDNGVNAGPEELDYVKYGADLIFGRKIGIVQGVLGYEYIGSRFGNNNLLEEFNFDDARDRESESLHLDLSWRFGEKTSVFGRIQKTDIEYDRQDTLLDSTQSDLLVGLRWRPTNSLSGAIGYGFSDKDFDDPRRNDFDNGIYYANLSYELSPFSVITLNAARTFEEPGEEEADFYQSEIIGLAWGHSLSTKVSFDIYAKAIDDDFNTGREDSFFDWGAEIHYFFRSWLTASVFYGEIERESTREEIEYDDRYYGIRLRSDLRPLFDSRRKNKQPNSFGDRKKTGYKGKSLKSQATNSSRSSGI